MLEACKLEALMGYNTRAASFRRLEELDRWEELRTAEPETQRVWPQRQQWCPE